MKYSMGVRVEATGYFDRGFSCNIVWTLPVVLPLIEGGEPFIVVVTPILIM